MNSPRAKSLPAHRHFVAVCLPELVTPVIAKKGEEFKGKSCKNRVTSTEGSGSSSRARSAKPLADMPRYPIFLTFAAAGPFCPFTTSNSTLCPSDRDLKPFP